VGAPFVMAGLAAYGYLRASALDLTLLHASNGKCRMFVFEGGFALLVQSDGGRREFTDNRCPFANMPSLDQAVDYIRVGSGKCFRGRSILALEH